MSGPSLQKQLDLAHKIVSKEMGYEYNLYRPLTNIDPLDDANFIDNVLVTVGKDDSYSSAMGWEIPVWTMYTDAAQVREGDFLHSDVQNRTFFITSKKAHLPVMAVEVPQRIDIMSVAYANTGTGYAPGNQTYVARNLPAFVAFTGTVFSGLVPGRNMAVVGARTLTVITHFPDQSILTGDTLKMTSTSFTGDILSYDFSPIGLGVRFTAQEMSL